METYKRDVQHVLFALPPRVRKVKETTLLRIPVGEPFQCVGMDLRRWTLVQMETNMPWFSRVISLSGLRFSLLRTDLQLQWPELVWRHGVLAKITHDRAAEFLSDVLQDTAAILGIKQLPTS